MSQTPQRKREYMKERKAKFISEGLCGQCGNVRIDYSRSKSYCTNCLDIRSKASKKYCPKWRKKKIDAKLCIICGVGPQHRETTKM